MIFYHFLHRLHYELLLSRGYLNANREHMWIFQDKYENMIAAYDWMVKLMQETLPPKPKHSGEYPVWLWHRHGCPIAGPTFDDVGFIKEEDREHYKHESDFLRDMDESNNAVRLTLEIDPKLVLLTHFDWWHFPLNNWYIHPDSANEDMDDFNKQLLCEKRASWHHPKHVIPREKYHTCKYGINQDIQATIWLLTLDMVTEVKFR